MPETVVVAHPSPDLYGSDLQLLESVAGLHEAGYTVRVVLPMAGPLVARLTERGAEVTIMPVPVLRKSLLRPLPFLSMLARLPATLVRSVRFLRRHRPVALYVNTVTVPTWLLAGAIARVPRLGHVHEAEEDQARLIRFALALPAKLADQVLVNSAAAGRVLAESVKPLRLEKVQLVYNGILDPGMTPRPDRPDGPATLVVVGRLSPRKGTDVALEALAELVGQHRDVRLRVGGSIFPGYEWFQTQLQDRAARPDLAGRVELLGYVQPIGPLLAEADIVVVPSRVEPFGNTAVEAMLSGRPLVASAVQGLKEIVTDGSTGLLAEPGDPHALAAAIARLLDDPAMADRLAAAGRAEALERFSVGRYRDEIAAAVAEVARLRISTSERAAR